MKIGNIRLKNNIIIAPMAGISNDSFRELCFEFGAGLVEMEMVSDKAIFYMNRKTLKMLENVNNIHPISIQLFGSDPKTMAYATKYICKNVDVDIIDINMGCPVNKVVKTGAGAALMKDEKLAVKVVKAVIKESTKPVTVKMRLGWDKNSINYLSLAKKLEKAGVSAIALHARTRSQMYHGNANWDAIRKLKQIVNIPVIGNGDIKSVEDYAMYHKYCDAVMIGRGVVGNPFLIKQINNYIIGKRNIKISYKSRFKQLLNHTNKLIKLKGEKSAIYEMRGLASHYINGLYMCSSYKNRLSSINSLKDLKNILDDYVTLLEKQKN